MSRIRILFLGTPEFAVPSLKGLVEDEHFEVVGVVSQPDRPAGRKLQLQASPVKTEAQNLGLTVYTPEKASTPEFISIIKNLEVEAAVVVAYGQILSRDFLETFRLGCVNVHASLLPRWRGAAPIQRAVMAGDQVTGVCLQRMVRKLDAGAVLGSRQLNIDDDMDALTLHDALKQLGPQLLHVEFMDYLRGNLMGQAQDETLVTYAHKIEKSEGLIDWKRPARDVFNFIRGMTMGPIASTQWQGKTIKLYKTQIVPNKGGNPGEVKKADADGLVVACQDQGLSILELQMESKRRQSVQEFIRGVRINVGDVLR